MEYRALDITVISANGLTYVNHIRRMKVYTVVTLVGDQRIEKRTPVDKDGGQNPIWNHPMNFVFEEAAAQQDRLTLEFKLISVRTVGVKEIGSVDVPVRGLLVHRGDGNSAQSVSYQVRNSGEARGELNFSYNFGEKFAGTSTLPNGQEPVTAYTAQASGYVHPRPQPGNAQQPAIGMGLQVAGLVFGNVVSDVVSHGVSNLFDHSGDDDGDDDGD